MRKYVKSGVNDLKTKYPDIALEFDTEKNGISPSEVASSSSKKVWWKCKHGHSWKAAISNRTSQNKTNCPVCNALSKISFFQQAVYYYLKLAFGENVVFRPTFTDDKGTIESDFYVPDFVVIDCNSRIWYNTGKNKKDKPVVTDEEKKIRLGNLGKLLIRIRQSDENYEDKDIINYDYETHRLDNLSWAINKLLRNWFGIDIDIDVSRDNIAILEQYFTTEVKNNIAVDSPKLAAEWDYEKNGNLRPEYFSHSSVQEFWWKCDKGHSWKAEANRRFRGSECPYCSGNAVWKGFNDLATVNPELAKQWHPSKNWNLKPTMVTANSHEKVWWICDKGHEWEAIVSSRNNGSGCPICAGQKVLKGFNDLESQHPELAKQWHPTKNGDLKPSMVTCGCNRTVWWKCEKGHEWAAYVSNRVNGMGCPVCSNHKVLAGYNDLETLYPLLVKEWHPTKNGDLKPSMVVPGSGKRVWWKCVDGHEWQAVIRKRAILGQGCPICYKLSCKKKR